MYQRIENRRYTPYRTQNNYQPQPRTKSKHSGCKRVVLKRGSSSNERNISAWNVSKERGLITALIFATKYSDQPTSNGNVNLCAKVTFKRTGLTQLMKCVKSTKNGKFYIPALGMVANPDAPNGGYFGQSKRPRR